METHQDTSTHAINSSLEDSDLQHVRNIVCAVDVCDHDQRALQRALHLGAKANADVHVVCVYQTPFWFVQDLSAVMAGEIDRILTRELSKAATEHVSLKRHVVEGQPLEQIMEVAKRVQGDVIVVQKTNKPLRVPRWKGTIPDRLRDESSIPVLTVPLA